MFSREQRLKLPRGTIKEQSCFRKRKRFKLIPRTTTFCKEQKLKLSWGTTMFLEEKNSFSQGCNCSVGKKGLNCSPWLNLQKIIQKITTKEEKTIKLVTYIIIFF
jgi:hypothetical protein